MNKLFTRYIYRTYRDLLYDSETGKGLQLTYTENRTHLYGFTRSSLQIIAHIVDSASLLRLIYIFNT